MKITVVNSLND